MTPDLFAPEAPSPQPLPLSPGALLLPGFATAVASTLLDDIRRLTDTAPFRHLQTRMGFSLSVAMSNAGDLGWHSDRRGYRYVPADPLTDLPWPAIPTGWLTLAAEAASAAGYPDFVPDACLVNRYDTGARMGLHQDRDEPDLAHPIVSVSLGVPATFLWGGEQREDKASPVTLQHGDVVVWGGASRLRFHGIRPLRAASHALTGSLRYNLTFRCAGAPR